MNCESDKPRERELGEADCPSCGLNFVDTRAMLEVRRDERERMFGERTLEELEDMALVLAVAIVGRKGGVRG